MSERDLEEVRRLWAEFSSEFHSLQGGLMRLEVIPEGEHPPKENLEPVRCFLLQATEMMRRFPPLLAPRLPPPSGEQGGERGGEQEGDVLPLPAVKEERALAQGLERLVRRVKNEDGADDGAEDLTSDG